MAMTKVLSMKTKLPVACTCPPSNICLDNARLEYELQSVSKSTYCMYFLKVVKTKTNILLSSYMLMYEAMCQNAEENMPYSEFEENIPYSEFLLYEHNTVKII